VSDEIVEFDVGDSPLARLAGTTELAPVWWTEDKLVPRVDKLTRFFSRLDDVLPVAHPEYFQPGDIVRVGDEERYDTGEREEWTALGWTEGPRMTYEEAVELGGYEVWRVRNEAVMVVSTPDMRISRPLGANPRQSAEAGEIVMIIASVLPQSPEPPD
jgi:hypothetical protein